MNDPYQTLPPQPMEMNKLAPEPPQRIGRYRVESVLGQGGFGLVYLAHDEQLHRLVAIKVPHGHLLSCPEHQARQHSARHGRQAIRGGGVVQV